MSFIATIRYAVCSSAAMICLFAASGAEAGNGRDPLVIRGIGPESWAPEPYSAYGEGSRDHFVRGAHHSARRSYAPRWTADFRPIHRGLGRRAVFYGSYGGVYHSGRPYDDSYRPAAYSAADAFPPPPPPSYGYFDELPCREPANFARR